MAEHLSEALFAVLGLKNLALLCIGVLAGVVVGALPGLSVTMAVVLVLPFTFTLTPIEGMSTMLGVLVGGLSGGLISAVLVGIPGTPGAVATTFDGFVMSRAGRPGLALALGLWASFFGGCISAALLLVLAPSMARIGLEFGPWEYFALIVFALTIAASLSSENMLKGLIAAVGGLVIAAIGEDVVNGVPRLTYGLDSLESGLGFLPILIGIFAFGQLLADVRDPGAAKNPLAAVQGQHIRLEHREAIRLILTRWPNLIRSSLAGMFIGLLPAVGGTVSNFVAYDQAKKASNEPETFGTGTPDGIIAPESANNATAGGSLTILMALGIPGDAVAAVMLGALMIHNVVPSPSFVRDQPTLAYGILLAFLFAHVATVIIQSGAIRFFLQSLRVPIYILAAVILSYCAIGAFSLGNRLFDVWVIFWFGVLGYTMRMLEFPSPPLILGVVLGSLAETNLARALSINSSLTEFFTRPMSLLFIILAVFSALFPWYQAQRARGGWTIWYVPALCICAGAPLLAMPGYARPAVGVGLIAMGAVAVWKRIRAQRRLAL